MAQYEVQDNDTGRIVTFDWNGDKDPTDDDMAEVFAAAKASAPPAPIETPPPSSFMGKTNEDLVKRAVNIEKELSASPDESVLQTLGRAPGRALRTVGQAAGFVNDATVNAIGSAYENFMPEPWQQEIASGFNKVMQAAPVQSTVKTLTEAYRGAKEAYPETMQNVEAAANIVGAIPVVKGMSVAGNAAEAAGRAATKSLSAVVKETVGAYTGRGPGFIEEMVKGGKAAEKAMRGEITGEEIVGHAKDALQKVRDMRGSEYLGKLDNIRANPEELNGIRATAEKKISQLAGPDDFDLKITVGKDGVPELDFSKSTIIEHQRVVQRAVEDLMTWDDNTARGLDTLTKRLSKYVDQAEKGTPAESFVTQLKNSVSNGLKKTVPEYEEMTRGYREASTLIKDIESNLMLRKEGMSGRITADQTLRRLSSALQEGKEMRKDLLLALGTESGMDIPGEVAGYLAKQWIPGGILGKGLTMGSAYALHFLNPAWWPVVAASSPRIVGEFLNAYGKAVRGIKGIGATRPPGPRPPGM